MNQKYNYQIYYHKFHDETEEHAEEQIKAFERMYGSYILSPSDDPVIDIGCGMGFGMMFLKRQGFTDVRGIDIDLGQIESCRRKNLQVECVTDPNQYLRESPNYYRMVLLTDVLEHVSVSEQLEFVRCLHDSLVVGGRLIVQVPNACSILASRMRYGDFTHTSSFTTTSLEFLLRNGGFNNVMIPVNSPVVRPSVRFWRKKARVTFRRKIRSWILDRFWRMAIQEYMPQTVASETPTTPNMIAIADRRGNDNDP